jgi:steroid delta-isomerase-like uncharacterized protein
LPDDRRDLPHRFYACWNAGDLDGATAMLAPDIHDHTGGVTGRDAVKAILAQVRAAFPDHQYSVQRVLADGDLLCVQLTASGTQQGDFFGYPATNKHASWTETRILRIDNGQIAEHWANVDTLGMLVQLGHIAPPDRANW